MRKKLEEYYDYLGGEGGYSKNTVAAYKNDLNQFMKWLEQRNKIYRSWEAVNPGDIMEYVFFLRKREYAPATKARKVAAVNRFFNHLAEWEEILENPAAEVEAPKVQKYKPKVLPRESVHRLLAVTKEAKTPKELRDRAMLEMLYGSGLRVTELVNLHVDDIDIANWNVRCQGRHGSSDRIVPLSPPAVHAIQEYLEKGRNELILDEDESLLFLNMRGNVLTRQGLWLIIKHYVEQAGISEAVTPHTLRHSFAVHRLNQGSDLTEVQELLGHLNLSSTLVYTSTEDLT